MYRLLRALAAFDVVKDLGGDEFELAPGGEFLCTDAPNSVRSIVLMHGSDNSSEPRRVRQNGQERFPAPPWQ